MKSVGKDMRKKVIKKFSKEKTFICFGIDINTKTIKKDNVNFINSSYKLDSSRKCNIV